MISHQPYQFANLHSHEPTMIVNNVIALAKTAKVFNVPTGVAGVVAEHGGGSGVAFAWEMQLLQGRTAVGV